MTEKMDYERAAPERVKAWNGFMQGVQLSFVLLGVTLLFLALVAAP